MGIINGAHVAANLVAAPVAKYRLPHGTFSSSFMAGCAAVGALSCSSRGHCVVHSNLHLWQVGRPWELHLLLSVEREARERGLMGDEVESQLCVRDSDGNTVLHVAALEGVSFSLPESWTLDPISLVLHAPQGMRVYFESSECAVLCIS